MIQKMAAIFIGSIFLGIGINGFILPYHFVEGGMIGIGLICKYLWNFPVGLTIVVASFPIYVMSWVFNRQYFYNSINGLLTSSFIIDLLEPMKILFHLSMPLSAIVGGTFIGIGSGLMLRFRTSTGGIDLLAQFIATKLPINVGILIYIFDAIIIIISSEVVPAKSVLYSALTITFVAISTTLINARWPKHVYYYKLP